MSDLQSIRSWNGSKNHAFEMLCCQLAECESMPRGSKYIRVGAPDGGLECYWRLPNGDEQGWQAKYFLSPPTASQWTQIEKSIDRALQTHPRLAKLYVCVPIDRADPSTGADWFMDQWKKHVAKWNGQAALLGRKIEFEFWGEHELVSRLALEENRGRLFFWLHKDYLSRQWFLERLEETLKNVGPRYTPNLNVKLSIVGYLNALGYTRQFIRLIINHYREVKDLCARLPRTVQELEPSKVSQLRYGVTRLLRMMRFRPRLPANVPWQQIAELARACGETSFVLAAELSSPAKPIQDEQLPNESEKRRLKHEIEADSSRFWALASGLHSFAEFAYSKYTALASGRELLIVGEAGTGKTHLLCDVAKQRLGEDLPTVLLLGGQFSTGEPWSQIVTRLRLQCTADEFLGAMDAAANALQKKALILIDALNEGPGTSLWPRELGGMLAAVRRYKWIGVGLSVRSSFEELIVPKDLAPNELIRVEHRGFAGRLLGAMTKFFDYFGIKHPDMPMLDPEFSNPLFLKLFCEAIANEGLHEVPVGLEGITSIFKYFLDSINKKLARPEFVNFNVHNNVVQAAVNKLASIMAKSSRRWINHVEAEGVVNELLPPAPYHSSLFRHLVAEGVLSENAHYLENTAEKVVLFGYERLSDHLIAKNWLDSLPADGIKSAFQVGAPLAPIVEPNKCWLNEGLIEALSIQVPERCGLELLGIISPEAARTTAARRAFVLSLAWRARSSVSGDAVALTWNTIYPDENVRPLLWETLIGISGRPDHPLNASALHDFLTSLALPLRDRVWTIWLNQQLGDESAVERLLRWAGSPNAQGAKEPAIELSALAIGWFFTSSNRRLRDLATKRMVKLVGGRFGIFTRVLGALFNTNDPYVRERVLAASYGCALRHANPQLEDHAREILHKVFVGEEILPHLLSRDYARGVIECALRAGYLRNVDVSICRPPYKSSWPVKIPTKASLERKCKTSHKKQPDRGVLLLKYSVLDGDFARYILGTNWWHFDWSSVGLGRPAGPTRKELFDRFTGSLNLAQRRLFAKFSTSSQRFDLFQRVKESRAYVKQLFDRKPHSPEILKQALLRTLTPKQRTHFESHALPYLNNPNAEDHVFDADLAQRFILNRVFQLGWDQQLFGEYDADVADINRSRPDTERIGKKYQWIAYYEFLARVADNFEMRPDMEPDKEAARYDGPWQIDRRDFDPSVVLTHTKRETWGKQAQNSWLLERYPAIDKVGDNSKWLQSNDLPSIVSLLETTVGSSNRQFVVLETNVEWRQRVSPYEDRYAVPRRQFWLMIKSYLVESKYSDGVFQWAAKQDFMGRWMPESHGGSDLFLGEFYWAPAFNYFNRYYFNREGWTRPRTSEANIPQEIAITSDHYFQSESRDSAIKDSIDILLPSQTLKALLQLEFNVDHIHFELAGLPEIVVFDPSVSHPGPSALLVDKIVLQEFLAKKRFDIVWTVLGEKLVLGDQSSSNDSRLRVNGCYRLSASGFKGGIRTTEDPRR